MSDRSFGLLDLFGVLAVVVVLLILGAFLLLPNLTSSPAGAQMASCLSNLKQFGIATRLYSMDYTDHFPTVSPLVQGQLPAGTMDASTSRWIVMGSVGFINSLTIYTGFPVCLVDCLAESLRDRRIQSKPTADPLSARP